jgi:hypothetical protein
MKRLRQCLAAICVELLSLLDSPNDLYVLLLLIPAEPNGVSRVVDVSPTAALPGVGDREFGSTPAFIAGAANADAIPLKRPKIRLRNNADHGSCL